MRKKRLGDGVGSVFIIVFMKWKCATLLAVRIRVNIKDIHDVVQIACVCILKSKILFFVLFGW